MRILQVPHGYWPARGGAEALAQGFGEGLARMGHDVHVIVADLDTPEGLYAFGVGRTGRDDETRNGVSVRRIALGASYRAGGVLFRRQPYSDAALARRIRGRNRARLTAAVGKAIESLEPDVVITLPHLFENVRSVFAIREDSAFPMIWLPLLHEEDPNWPAREVERYVRRADGIIALTHHEGARLVDGYGADPGSVHIVPPGVDVPEAPPGPPAGPPTFLYLGRLSPGKGIGRLLPAMSEVRGRHPGARLVIAGAKMPDTPALLATVEASTRSGAVSVLVDVSDEHKQQLLRDASALVLPSRVESFGVVLLEAWAAATPVVAMDTPVLREVVRHGTDGLLCDPEDTSTLADAVVDLIEDPPRARRLGLAGHERVKSEYTWAKVAERLARVCETVAESGSEDPVEL